MTGDARARGGGGWRHLHASTTRGGGAVPAISLLLPRRGRRVRVCLTASLPRPQTPRGRLCLRCRARLHRLVPRESSLRRRAHRRRDSRRRPCPPPLATRHVRSPLAALHQPDHRRSLAEPSRCHHRAHSRAHRRSCAHRVLWRVRLCAQPEPTRLRLARVVYRRVLFGDSDGGFARGAKWRR